MDGCRLSFGTFLVIEEHHALLGVSMLRRNSSAESNVCFAVQRNRVLMSMAVPSIFKHNDDVPEKKSRKSKAAKNLHLKW